MSANHKAIIEEINEAMRRGDIDAFLARCTDDFVWTSVGEAPIQGKDAVRTFLAKGPQEPPVFTVDTLIGEGDVVVAQGTMNMKDAAGVDASHEYCDVWRVRGGQLASLDAFVIKTSNAPKTATVGSRR